jgi:hypothetical protein
VIHAVVRILYVAGPQYEIPFEEMRRFIYKFHYMLASAHCYGKSE